MRNVMTISLLVWSAAGWAQTDPVVPKWYERIKVDGLVEAYYSYRLQGSPTDKVNEQRAFDNNNNTITPSFGKIAASLAPEPAGFHLDVAFGSVADIGAPDIGSPGAEVFKHLLQAYASAKLFDRLTIDFGKFETSAGVEVFENNNNWLFSRSMIFGFGPYTHSGLRMSLPINEMVTLQGSIVNGWDNIVTAGIWKTFNLSGFFTFGQHALAINVYTGPHLTPQVRTLVDVNATLKFGEFGLQPDAIFGAEGDSKWFAGALNAKYTFAHRVRVAARIEYFGDPDGHRTTMVGSSFLMTTIGAGILVTPQDGFGSVEFRPEFRHDQQLAGGNVYVGGTSISQTTVQLAMLAWF